MIGSPDSYRLVAGAVGRTGAVAVAALALVPLAGLAVRRRRWAAFVLGGTVLVLALMLVPQLFTRFSDAVSLSQSRRAAGFVPFPFAFAGGLALVMRALVARAVRALAGILLQHWWPGDFEYGLRHGGPGIVTWWAFVGGAAALGLGLAFGRRLPAIPEQPRARRRGRGALRAAGRDPRLPRLDAARDARPARRSRPRSCASCSELPPRAVVIAPLETSYRILAAAAGLRRRRADLARRRHEGQPPEPPRPRRGPLARHRRPRDVERYGATWAVRKGRLYRLRRGRGRPRGP